MKNNSVCIVHNLKYLLEAQFNFFNLTTMTIKNNMTDLIISCWDSNQELDENGRYIDPDRIGRVHISNFSEI